MHKESSINDSAKQDKVSETIHIFSKEILRDVLLPDLLGREHAHILYWSGKQLARKFPLNNMEETIEFFKKAGWGELEEGKTGKKEALYILKGPIIERRLDLNPESEFQLEAGFLAQQFQFQNKRITEAIFEIKAKTAQVHLIVRWDSKDLADNE